MSVKNQLTTTSALTANALHKKVLEPYVLPDGNGVIVVLHEDSSDISFEWSFGPLTLVVSLDIATLVVEFTVYITVPILGRVELGSISGDLTKGGVTLSFNVYVASGTITLYIKDGYLWANIDVKSIVGNYDKDIQIFKIPFTAKPHGPCYSVADGITPEFIEQLQKLAKMVEAVEAKAPAAESA
ncbi:hypothetical protein SISNIDRAFT_487918 [Sistotremastrum niveocremeum HHB9708]|uniref:Uncharacterized protein n=1 Tax=Sistotremastrum niveocremeum HHB9708 TaxID=1314777 RepID=A0A164RUN2_9AGAM|nr:hypothetical protein SISNIDRAFT_487918 [Sistotremastrum niveocremeum HHB9708]